LFFKYLKFYPRTKRLKSQYSFSKPLVRDSVPRARIFFLVYDSSLSPHALHFILPLP